MSPSSHSLLLLQYGNTALMAASNFGHTEVVQELIGRGAMLDVQNEVCTASCHAVICNPLTVKIVM